MTKILLTGATGFLGRQCCRLLADGGWQVHAVTSRVHTEASQKPSSNLFWHQADLLDARQTRDLLAEVRPQYLLHLAWCSTAPGQFWTSPLNFRWVQASLELLQAFAEYDGQRVVLAGTCAEYDWTSVGNDIYCQEAATPLRPTTIYGTCKHALQLLLEAWTTATNISTAWGRTFFLYGPHEHPNRVVPATIRALLHETPARCSPGYQVRDFLHVQDAAGAFVALLQSTVRGPINIASGQPSAIKDVVCSIGDLLGRRDLIELGALPAPSGEPPFLVADIQRLRDEVGWTPHYDLEAGLRDSIHWWRAKEHAMKSHLPLERGIQS